MLTFLCRPHIEGTPDGFLALDDPIQFKDSDPQRSQGDL